jgi:NAD(P)-dependent dehydrogenase (short-subunit alcohol dehydrogenase family)
MRLAGKVALITGAASGMGQSEASLFAREGASVVVGDILESEGQRVVASIAAAGGKAQFVKLDVTREAEWQQAVKSAVMSFGKLDVLVNNAGISGSFDPDTMSTFAWDTLMEVNAKGVFLGMKHAVPAMQQAGGGAIVNISSISGFVGQDRIHMAYNASKAAVRIMTKSAAVQYAHAGIRVNSVHPGILPAMRTSKASAGLAGEGAPGRAHEARGPGGRGGLRRALPGLRRGVLHHRDRAGRGRRLPGRLRATPALRFYPGAAP